MIYGRQPLLLRNAGDTAQHPDNQIGGTGEVDLDAQTCTVEIVQDVQQPKGPAFRRLTVLRDIRVWLQSHALANNFGLFLKSTDLPEERFRSYQNPAQSHLRDRKSRSGRASEGRFTEQRVRQG